jgi:hypothetical protein
VSVKSRDFYAYRDEQKETKRPKRRRIGFISGGGAETVFVWLLRLAGVALIAVSIVGSFYGLQGKEAEGPLQAIPAMAAGWPWLLGALLAQLFLSVGQWGSRKRAMGDPATVEGKRRHTGGDPRFWFVYLALLAFSAALNWIAYGGHLLDWGVPLALAALAVIAGDALAEFVLVLDE